MLSTTTVGTVGLPLVFLHGAFGCGADAHAVATGLTPRRCLLVDLPGHGPASAAHGPTSFEAALDDIAATLPAQCDLVGYSMGARLALAFAVRAPERVRRLVLESGTAGLADSTEARTRRTLDDERGQALLQDPAAFLRAFWDLPLFASLSRHPQREALIAERIARVTAHPAPFADALRNLSVGRQPNLWPSLEHVRAPTLVVTGALDDRFTALGAALTDALPIAQHVVIDDAGHRTHLEQPAAFCSALRNFLGEDHDRRPLALA